MRRALAAAAVCLSLALGACAPSDGLRVESQRGAGTDAPSSPDPDPGSGERPFDAEAIRTALLDSDLSGLPTSNGNVEEVLLYCSECLALGDPLMAGDQKFQLATVQTPGSEITFAGFAIASIGGKPAVKLSVSGSDLSLRPGHRGTVVVQQSVYKDGDAADRPSGWSVQVYRYRDGQFERGQRITKVNE